MSRMCIQQSAFVTFKSMNTTEGQKKKGSGDMCSLKFTGRES